MPPEAPTLEEIASAFLSAFNTLSAANHTSLRTATCTHIFAPSSVNIAPKSNTEFAAHLSSLVPILSSFSFTTKELHINESARQITIWVAGSPRFREEVMDGEAGEWEIASEYIFILDVNSEGNINRVLEFMDTQQRMEMKKLAMRARQNLRANEEQTS